jgi:hypothetical protein
VSEAVKAQLSTAALVATVGDGARAQLSTATAVACVSVSDAVTAQVSTAAAVACLGYPALAFVSTATLTACVTTAALARGAYSESDGMSIIMPAEGERAILEALLDAELTVRLYVNDMAPGEHDTAASFTEAAGGGYAGKVLQFADWTFSGVNPTIAAYPVLTWTFTGALSGTATIHGYVVTRADGTVLWAERMAGFTPAASGDYRSLALRLGIG